MIQVSLACRPTAHPTAPFTSHTAHALLSTRKLSRQPNPLAPAALLHLTRRGMPAGITGNRSILPAWSYSSTWSCGPGGALAWRASSCRQRWLKPHAIFVDPGHDPGVSGGLRVDMCAWVCSLLFVELATSNTPTKRVQILYRRQQRKKWARIESWGTCTVSIAAGMCSYILLHIPGRGGAPWRSETREFAGHHITP